MNEHYSPRSVGRLGETLEWFGPSRGKLLAGFVIGLGIIGGGLALARNSALIAYEQGYRLPNYADKGDSWASVAVFFVIAIGLVVGGVFVIRYLDALRSGRVELCANGFRRCSRESREEVAWEEVAEVRQRIDYERMPIFKGPAMLLAPVHASTSYEVVLADGRSFRFNADAIGDTRAFGDRLRAAAEAHGLGWKVEEVDDWVPLGLGLPSEPEPVPGPPPPSQPMRPVM